MKEVSDITQSSAGQVFYTSAYHYRRTPVLIVSVILLLICAPLLVRFVWELVQSYQSADKFLIGLFPTTILGILAFVGGTLLRYYLTGHSLLLVIDRDGVRYGGRCYPWQDIGSLQGRIMQSSIQLLLHRRGRIALDRYLQTNDGLTAAEYEALMMKLQAEIAARHEHLDFA